MKNSKKNRLVFIAILLAFFYTKSNAQHTLEEVRIYDSFDTWVTGINNQGAICGYYYDPTVNAERGFVIPPNGRYRFFYPADGYTHSRVVGINNNDSFTVLLRMSNSTGLSDEAVVYKSYYRPLGDSFSTKEIVTGIEPNNPSPTGINSKEVMCGWNSLMNANPNQPRNLWLYFDDVLNTPSGYATPFYSSAIFSGGQNNPTFTGGVNDSNQLVGYYYNLATSDYNSYLYDINAAGSAPVIFSNLGGIQLQGINNAGFVVGKRKLSGQTRPFMGTFSGSTLLNMPIPIFTGGLGITSEFADVNDKEEIVGSYIHPVTGKSVGFIYRRNRDEYRLKDFDFIQNTWRFQNTHDYAQPPEPIDTSVLWTDNFYGNFNYDQEYDIFSDQDANVTRYTGWNTKKLNFATSPSWFGFAVEIDKENFRQRAKNSASDSELYQTIKKGKYLEKLISKSGAKIMPDSVHLFADFKGYCYGMVYAALQSTYDSTTYSDWFHISPVLNAYNYGNSDVLTILALERTQQKASDKNTLLQYGVNNSGTSAIHLTQWKGQFRMKNYMMQTKADANPRGLTFRVNQNPELYDSTWGWHIVLPYKVKTANTLPLDYPSVKYDSIFVYDPNFPQDSMECFLVNPTLGVMNPSRADFSTNVSEYFGVDSIQFNTPGVRDSPLQFGHPEQSQLKPTGIPNDDSLYNFAVIGSNSFQLLNNSTVTASLQNGVFSNSDSNLIPVIQIETKPSTPHSFWAASTASTKIKTTNYSSQLMRYYASNNSYVMSINREDASATQTDHGSVTNRMIAYGNPDNTTKKLFLNFIQDDDIDQYGVNMIVRNFKVKQSDSIITSNPAQYQYKIQRIGGDTTTYQLELYVFEDGNTTTLNTDILIDGNTTHTIEPYYNGSSGHQVVIYVDNGNNGTLEDTLFLNTTSIGPFENDNSINVYPNPVNDKLVVSIDSKDKGNYLLDMYDIKGGRILSQLLKIQDSKSIINTASLSSGTYFLRIYKDGKVVYRKKVVRE